LKNLKFDRPLVVLDLETTGTDPATDRIVEVSAIRVEPGGTRGSLTRRVDPGRPIPPEATRVHGISDDDVRGQPTFPALAPELLEYLADADLGGFNILRFDGPLLAREFADAGLDLGLEHRRVLDVMTIFHRKEPRDLSAAVRFYLGRELAGAHSASADTEAALEVLDAQLGRYPDLPRGVDDLARWCRQAPADAADRSGKFVWRGGRVVLSFGKHQGKSLQEMAREQPGYLEWILKSDFPADARRLVEEALRGRFPEPPKA
jgi:DNA polymerase-3 subunit epsilon